MSREIKFRAWDTTFGIMLNDIVVWDSNSQCIAILDQPAQWAYGDKLDERMELNFEGSVPEWYCFTGGFEIMQFTGLKDRHGMEIYEGDIVKGLNSKIYRFGNMAEIKFEPDYAGYIIIGEYHRNQHHENLSCDWAMEIEVIGNIHEHPHLLQ